MDVSIILVSYNTKDLTRDCIKSIFEKTHDLKFDIWIVDNASIDGSVEMIEQEFPHINLIKSKENLGFGRANNVAIRKINSKYVFLLNTDTVLINNAVKIMFNFLEQPENIDVGACGGQLYNADMTLQGSTGHFEDLNWLFQKSFGLNWSSRINRFKRIFKKEVLKEKECEAGQDILSQEADFIIGADLMLKKAVLDKSGLFDERFFMFAEEAELCFRIRKNGFKVMFLPSAKVIHFGGISANKSNTSIAVEQMRLTSNLMFYKLCYGEKAAKIAKFFYVIYRLRYLFLRFFSQKEFKRLTMTLKTKI